MGVLLALLPASWALQRVTISYVSPCSNPKVQVEAIEGGALQKLLVILATDQPLPAKKKASLLPTHAIPRLRAQFTAMVESSHQLMQMAVSSRGPSTAAAH